MNLSSPQRRILLRESDVELRKLERLAAGGNEEAAMKALRLRQRMKAEPTMRAGKSIEEPATKLKKTGWEQTMGPELDYWFIYYAMFRDSEIARIVDYQWGHHGDFERTPIIVIGLIGHIRPRLRRPSPISGVSLPEDEFSLDISIYDAEEREYLVVDAYEVLTPEEGWWLFQAAKQISPEFRKAYEEATDRAFISGTDIPYDSWHGTF